METNNDSELIRYINLKLAALGQPSSNYYQKDQLRGDLLCPADTRVQAFLDSYLSDVAPGGAPRLPASSFVLDRPGLARVTSLPPGVASTLGSVAPGKRADLLLVDGNPCVRFRTFANAASR